MSPAYICEPRMICRCLRISEEQLDEACRRNEQQGLQSVIESSGAGTGCTACRQAIADYLNQSTCRRD